MLLTSILPGVGLATMMLGAIVGSSLFPDSAVAVHLHCEAGWPSSSDKESPWEIQGWKEFNAPEGEKLDESGSEGPGESEGEEPDESGGDKSDEPGEDKSDEPSGEEDEESEGMARRDQIGRFEIYWLRNLSETKKPATERKREPGESVYSPVAPIDLDSLPAKDALSVSPRGTIPPWPTCFTKANCCFVSYACYNFFQAHPKPPSYISLKWKQGQCCWQRMVENKRWTNPPLPPHVETLHTVLPPYCID